MDQPGRYLVRELLRIGISAVIMFFGLCFSRHLRLGLSKGSGCHLAIHFLKHTLKLAAQTFQHKRNATPNSLNTWNFEAISLHTLLKSRLGLFDQPPLPLRTNLAVPAGFTTEPLSAEIFVTGIPAPCTTSAALLQLWNFHLA